MSGAHHSKSQKSNFWDLSVEQALQITKQDHSATGGFSEFQDLSRTLADR
jgi:hypothetical protein